MKLVLRALGYAAAAVLTVAAYHALDLASALALAAIGVGLWWERPSLGLIVPGAIVLALAVLGRLRALREG